MKSFNKSLKKIERKEHVNGNDIKESFKQNLTKYVNQHPDSGAGIGDVWKKRIHGRNGFRIIYFAMPKHSLILGIYIYPKNKQSSMNNDQKKYIRTHITMLKERVNSVLIMKQSDFNEIKEGFKEAADFLKGKKVSGVTKDVIHIHQHSTPIQIVKVNSNPYQIKKLRLNLHLSQDNFAKILGVSSSSVKSWEQGRRKPNNSTLHLMKLLHDNHKRVNELVTNK